MRIFTSIAHAISRTSARGALCLFLFTTSCTVYYPTAHKLAESDGIYADQAPKAYPRAEASAQDSVFSTQPYYGEEEKVQFEDYDSQQEARAQDSLSMRHYDPHFSAQPHGRIDIVYRDRCRFYAYPYLYRYPNWREVLYPEPLPWCHTGSSFYFYRHPSYVYYPSPWDVPIRVLPGDPIYVQSPIPHKVYPYPAAARTSIPSRTYTKNPRYRIQASRTWRYSPARTNRSEPRAYPYRSPSSTAADRRYKASRYQPVHASRRRSASPETSSRRAAPQEQSRRRESTSNAYR